MLKSIATSPKYGVRKNSSVKYDFSQVFQDLPSLNQNVNNRVQKYEECQSLSERRAGYIRSR